MIGIIIMQAVYTTQYLDVNIIKDYQENNNNITTHILWCPKYLPWHSEITKNGLLILNDKFNYSWYHLILSAHKYLPKYS